MSNINFEKRWEAKHPLYRLETVLRSYIDYRQVPANECKNMLISIRDTVVTAYFDKNEMAKAPNIGSKAIKNRSAIKKFVSAAQKLCQRLVILSRNIAKANLSKKSNQELANIYKKYFQLFAGLFAYYNLSRPDYLSGIEELVMRYINQKEKSPQKQKNIFSMLTTPTQNSLLVLHDIAQLKFVLSALKSENYHSRKSLSEIIRQDKTLLQKLGQLIKDYAWISTQENNPPLDLNFYLRKAKELISLGDKILQKKITELQRKPSSLLKKKHLLIKKYSFSKDLIKIADSIADLARLRLAIRFWWTESSFFGIDLFKELNRRFGFRNKKIGNFYYSEYLLENEAVAGLKNKSKFSVEQIRQRSKKSLLLMINKNIKLFVGKKADKVEKEYISKIDYSKIKEIKGNIANGGVTKGKTWVISPSVANQVKKAKQMPRGYILVAAMTRPQFIEAISKASAIVTDEGGITCHAAIISRELGKPCIIGTKIATKVLKDGMMVEVNADRGIIKILKNNER